MKKALLSYGSGAVVRAGTPQQPQPCPNSTLSSEGGLPSQAPFWSGSAGAHAGPMEVKLSYRNDTAEVTIYTDTARKAIAILAEAIHCDPADIRVLGARAVRK